MEGNVKFVVSPNGDVEAYDLNQDPGELNALPLTPEQIEAARERAEGWWAAHPLLPEAEDIDEEIRDRLQAVGYGG